MKRAPTRIGRDRNREPRHDWKVIAREPLIEDIACDNARAYKRSMQRGSATHTT